MKPLVSISCITYNHEKYIADALESFLMQKTDFNFEILIHDDASTDNTPEIIRRYVDKFPNIIKPIYQKENQFSKGKKIGPTYNFTRALGKYIAMCEGDDFWVDPYKLQIQVDYMEKNSECSLCFHNAEIQKASKKKSNHLMLDYSINSGKYSVGELSLLGFIPTASLIFPKYIFDEFPEWFAGSIVGDLPIILIAASKGYAYYFDDIMSVYRTDVDGSATSKIYKSKNKKEKLINLHNGVIEILKNVDIYTNGKFNNELQCAIANREVEVLLLEKNKHKLKENIYIEHFKGLSNKQRYKFWIRYYIPTIYEKMGELKVKIKKNR